MKSFPTKTVSSLTGAQIASENQWLHDLKSLIN